MWFETDFETDLTFRITSIFHLASCKCIITICRSNCCQTIATRSHPSGTLTIAKCIIQLTAGTLALAWLWPYGQWRGAAMTRFTPGRIPITGCSSEKQTSTKHDSPAVTINGCQAADYRLSQVYLKARSTCDMSPKRRQSGCCSKAGVRLLSVWMSWVTQPLSGLTHRTGRQERDPVFWWTDNGAV